MNKRLEDEGLQRLARKMRECGWYVRKMHGNKFQRGIPDLLCIHRMHGTRWIEGKLPNQQLSPVQRSEFYKMHQAGAKIYVLVDERDYDKLLGKPNWTHYAAFPGDYRLPQGFGLKRTKLGNPDRI